MIDEQQNSTLSVVIPLYREGAHLPETMKEIVRVLKSTGMQFEIILVDDGSPDNTWAAILEQKKQYDHIQGVRLSRNFGKEAALAAGLELAQGNVILVMDGDLQHPPALIPEMLQQWHDGAEVVEAVKRSRGTEKFISRLRAKIFYTAFSALTDVDLRGASDFKLMDRRVLKAWLMMHERNLFFRGMSAWLGFRRVQIPFDVAERVDGQTGWSAVHLIKLAITAVASFSSAPLYLIVAIATTYAVFAILLGIQTLYLKFNGYGVDGFTTVILLTLITGSAIMFGLGLIGIYIARIYNEVKARPRYIIADQAK